MWLNKKGIKLLMPFLYKSGKKLQKYKLNALIICRYHYPEFLVGYTVFFF